MLSQSRSLLLLARLEQHGLLRMMACPQGNSSTCGIWLYPPEQQQQQQQQQQGQRMPEMQVPLAALHVRLMSSKAHSGKQKQHAGKSKKHQRLQQQTVVDNVATHQQQQHPATSKRTQDAATGRSSSKQSNAAVQQPPPSAHPSPAAAALPLLGRVPPSSSAAAAAAAAASSMGRGRTAPVQRSKQTPAAAAAAAGAMHDSQQQEGASNSRLLQHRPRRPRPSSVQAASAATADEQASSAAAAAAAAAAELGPFSRLQPPTNILPWDLVASLPRSCPFTLERMANSGVRTYLSYMAAARQGMPSVFGLTAGGVERGRGDRKRLLRRERLLEMLLQQVYTMQQITQGLGQGNLGQALGQVSHDPGQVGHNSGQVSHQQQGLQQQEQQQQQQQQGQGVHHHQQDGEQQQQQHQQQQEQGVAGMAAGWEWEPTDEQLEELSEQHIAAVAAAAAESSDPLLAGVQGKDAALCLMDYFVFKRCVEVLLLQRQHREAMKAKHNALLQEYHAEQQQQQQQQQQEQQQQQQLTLLTASELSEVKVWDAFFDATLQDYMKYLKSAAKGHPSVFTASRDDVLLHPQPPQQQTNQHNRKHHNRQQQQQQQQQQQLYADPQHDEQHSKAVLEFQQTCLVLSNTARMLSQLPKKQQHRPGLITNQQLMLFATDEGCEGPEQVVGVLQEFYDAKQLAFKEVLEELMAAAGPEALDNISWLD